MDGDTSQDMRFAPPQAHVEDVVAAEGALAPARRLDRFWAAMIDMGIAVGAELLADWQLPKAWTESPESPLTPALMPSLVGYALFLAINGWLLVRRGQTLGKLALGLRIVRPDGSPVGPARMLLVRYGMGFVFSLATVAQILNLLDALLIFRESRRCLHDQIADTIVVKA